MQKNTLSRLLIVVASYLTNAYALPAVNTLSACRPTANKPGAIQKNRINSKTICGQGNSSLVQINGGLTAQETTFIKPLTVNGPVSALHSVFAKEASFYGPILLQSISATNIQAHGPLIVNDSQLANLAIWSNLAQLSHTQTKAIIIHSAGQGAKLYIDQGSVIHGNVEFVGDKTGIVYLDRNSEITGSVINGKIIVKK